MKESWEVETDFCRVMFLSLQLLGWCELEPDVSRFSLERNFLFWVVLELSLVLLLSLCVRPAFFSPVRLLENDLWRFRLELELLDTFVLKVPFLFSLSSKLFFLESFFRCEVSFLFSTT